MTNSDKIVAVIRTAVPAGIGYLLALLISAIPAVGDAVTWIDQQIAQALPDAGSVTVLGLLQALAVALVVAAYYWLARWIGDRYPAIERLLLGSSKTPVYTPALIEEVILPLPGESREEYRERVGKEFPE